LTPIDGAVKAVVSAVRERDADRALREAVRLKEEVLNRELHNALCAVVASLKTVKAVETPYAWKLCDAAARNLEKTLEKVWESLV
jgi:hypothetical protein